jgi:hypothetical protein
LPPVAGANISAMPSPALAGGAALDCISTQTKDNEMQFKFDLYQLVYLPEEAVSGVVMGQSDMIGYEAHYSVRRRDKTGADIQAQVAESKLRDRA